MANSACGRKAISRNLAAQGVHLIPTGRAPVLWRHGRKKPEEDLTATLDAAHHPMQWADTLHGVGHGGAGGLAVGEETIPTSGLAGARRRLRRWCMKRLALVRSNLGGRNKTSNPLRSQQTLRRINLDAATWRWSRRAAESKHRTYPPLGRGCKRSHTNAAW